jgi:uncharacterized protein YbaR (Trm112 family)/SAM-dependent methyltransferase
MNKLSSLIPLLKCPKCNNPSLQIVTEAQELRCSGCDARYPVVQDRPVLLCQDNPIFPIKDYLLPAPSRTPAESSGLKRFIPTPSVNVASNRVLGRLKSILTQAETATVLVVGGGRQRSWLDQRLSAGPHLKLIYSDIDVGADVDLFCDGHDLPFVDGCVDSVITTAVLEHVLYPERVAAEIHRVLKTGGLLYSELPFMQQVHEGAYDFTRYTLSGHRRLFNGFTEIETGMVAGPATAMVWAIENLALALVRRPVSRTLTKAGVRLLFAWLKWLDYLLVNRPEAMDGASCTYFLGTKTIERVSDLEIINRYVGAKHLRHS